MEILRTPEDRFAAVRDWYEPTYLTTSDGLRLAVVDEGPREAPVMLLLHGEPSWSYLWRKVAAPLLEAGFRVVAPDLIGFGRSDKPAQVADHSYERHVEWLRSALFDGLDLREITLVCQDWGGLVGLRLLGEHADRFTRVVATNTGLPDGSYTLPPEWWKFRDFVDRTDDLPIGLLVQFGSASELPEHVVAAYDAPFPDAAYKAGPKAMPDLIPQDPDNVAAKPAQAAWDVLRRFEGPFLCAFSDGDPITRGADALFTSQVPGAQDQPHTTIADAAHFVQEDQGERLGEVIVDWMQRLGVR
jgi:haloalkane dehalogenase